LKDIELKNDELLNEEDYKLIDTVNFVRKHIMSYYDKGTLVEKIKKIINDSEVVNFRNSRSSEFIETRRPVFVLKVDEDSAFDKYETDEFFNDTAEINYYNDVLYNEIINEFSTFLMEAYRELNNKAFEDINENELKMATGLLSSICGTRVGEDDKTLITLEFLL